MDAFRTFQIAYKCSNYKTTQLRQQQQQPQQQLHTFEKIRILK